MNDKVKIKLYIGTGFAGCDHRNVEYVDRAEWEAMTEKEQDNYLDQVAQDFLENHIDFSAWVEEEESHDE